jgi:hypothetical protein
MVDILSPKTVGATAILAVLGIVFNTTREALTGTTQLLWVLATVVVAFVLVHGTQYARLKYSAR